MLSFTDDILKCLFFLSTNYPLKILWLRGKNVETYPKKLPLTIGILKKIITESSQKQKIKIEKALISDSLTYTLSNFQRTVSLRLIIYCKAQEKDWNVPKWMSWCWHNLSIETCQRHHPPTQTQTAGTHHSSKGKESAARISCTQRTLMWKLPDHSDPPSCGEPV